MRQVIIKMTITNVFFHNFKEIKRVIFKHKLHVKEKKFQSFVLTKLKKKFTIL